MREKIINAIVEANRNYNGIDKIKEELKIAMEITKDEVNWYDIDFYNMMTEILYRLEN